MVRNIVRRKEVSKKASLQKGKITKRVPRKISKPDRLGVRKSNENGDAFFANLRDQPNTTQISSESEEATNSASVESSISASNSMITLSSAASPHTISDENSNESETFRNPTTSTPTSLRSVSRSVEILESNNSKEAFEKVVIDSLKEILIRIKKLEKDVARLDTHMVELKRSFAINRNVSKSPTQINSNDPAELIPFDLPVNSTDRLEKLDTDLSNAEYLDGLVSAELSFWSAVLFEFIN